MNKVSKAILKENDELYKGCTFLEPREWLDGAIIGKCVKTGGIIYDFNTIVEVFMQKDGLSEEQAAEIIEFNMEKAIKYMPEPRPILDMDIQNEDDLSIEEDWD